MNEPSVDHLSLARHWLSIGQHDRALTALAELPGDEAAGYPAVLLRASALWLAGRHADAAEAASAAVAQFGPNPALLSVLGNAYGELGRWPEAEKALLEGLALDPEDVPLLCDYARLCLQAGQVDKAEKLVERAAAQQPDAPQVTAMRSLIAMVKGDDAEAVRLSAKAVGADPDSASARALHGSMTAQQGDVVGAYQSFRSAAADEPANSGYVEAAREARVLAHPLLRPLLPIYRFGPFKVWIAAVAIMLGLRAIGGGLPLLVFAGCWLLFCVYSWVAPPLVRRLVRRR